MRLARRVAAGLVLGAVIGFLVALLRPRGVPAARMRPVPPPPRTTTSSTGSTGSTDGPSPTVINDPATRPLVIPRPAPQSVTGGTA